MNNKKKITWLKVGNNFEETLHQRNTGIAHKHIKRCSESLSIRKMQSKTDWQHQLWQGYRPTGPFIRCCWWKTLWKFLIDTHLPYKPAITPLAICPKEMKTYIHTNICAWIVRGYSARPAKQLEINWTFLEGKKTKREQSHMSEYNLCSNPWLTTKLNKAQAKNTIAGRH